MPVTEVTVTTALALAATGAAAGALGGTLGIGGGVFLTPALVFLFGLPVKWAVPASLVSIAATSVAAAPRHYARGTSNLRIAAVLSLGAAAGGIAGGLISSALSQRSVLLILAGAAFLAATISAIVPVSQEEAPGAFAGEGADEWPGTLGGTYETAEGSVPYQARHPLIGASISGVAAVIGAIAGLGGGFINVPQMRLVMGLPVRVAASTSTFVVGLSASAGLAVYLGSGRIAPAVAGPLLVGSTIGSIAGASLQHLFKGSVLNWCLVIVLVLLGIQVTWGAFNG